MNNKLIGYDEAVGMLQELEKRQKIEKQRRKSSSTIRRELSQSLVEFNKDSINALLSIVDAHKQARKLYEEVRYYENILI